MSVIPLRVCVLGDSIMWGQGLHEEHKFSELVRSGLATALSSSPAIPVRLDATNDYLAHSGARIEQITGEPCKYLHGEIPRSAPSITWQANALSGPDAVRLVLLDGGANDLGMFTPMSPSLDLGTISSNANQAFGRISDLLTLIAKRFPNAAVVVCGVYQVVSTATPDSALGDLLYGLANPLGLGIPAFALASEAAAKVYVALHKGDIAAKYAAVTAACDMKSMEAVDAANAGRPSGPRFYYVPAPFTEENAYGASRSFLWSMKLPFLGPALAATSDDELYDYRQSAKLADQGVAGAAIPQSGPPLVDRVLAEMGFRFETRVVATAHPNVNGANAYATAILEALKPELDRWASDLRPPPPPPLKKMRATWAAPRVPESDIGVLTFDPTLPGFGDPDPAGSPAPGRVNAIDADSGSALSGGEVIVEVFNGPASTGHTGKGIGQDFTWRFIAHGAFKDGDPVVLPRVTTQLAGYEPANVAEYAAGVPTTGRANVVTRPRH